ncbi:MAG: hypothetical protein E7K80_11970, partial [Cutibacterium avidum]|nr:hypothetical protein [Cutibacterium avidum]
RYLGNKLNERGANVDDVAVQFRIPRSLASRILEGTAKPDEVAAWRASAMAQLVQDVYHDIDSYRHGLLCCQIDDPLNISISATDASEEFQDKYNRRAKELGISIWWLESDISLLDLKDIIPEIDKRAVEDGFDVSEGEIDSTRITLSTEAPSIRRDSIEKWYPWLDVR